MRFLVGVLGLVVVGLPAHGIDALDLLEGGDDPIKTLPSLKPLESAPVADGTSWDEDYSWRWLASLPPLWTLKLDGNAVVQEAALTGLFEWRYEAGTIEADGGNIPDQEVDSIEARRMRLGTVLRAFYNTDLEGELVFGGEGEYYGVSKLKATVHLTDDLAFSVGKFRPPFTQEYTQDPSMRAVPELSSLVAQIVPTNSLGVMASGHVGKWDWGAGWFSADRSRNIPGIEGSGFILAKVGYTFQGKQGGDRGDALPLASGGDAASGEEEATAYQRWYLDYIYNLDHGEMTSILGGHEHLLATGIQVSTGPFDLQGDFILANGDINTAWGMTLQGSYWLLEDAIRAVARYSYADSDDDNALLAGYGIPSGLTDTGHPFQYPVVISGDEIHSFYGGLNFHIFGDYIVLQAGTEYRLIKNQVANTPDISSWFWHVGGRAGF